MKKINIGIDDINEMVYASVKKVLKESSLSNAHVSLDWDKIVPTNDGEEIMDYLDESGYSFNPVPVTIKYDTESYGHNPESTDMAPEMVDWRLDDRELIQRLSGREAMIERCINSNLDELIGDISGNDGYESRRDDEWKDRRRGL